MITFGFKNGYEYLKNSLIFIIINVVFAGLTLLLWFFAAPFSMEHNNGFIYLDISFVTLIITTASAYGLIRLLRYIIDVKQVGDKEYKITISMSGKSVTLDAVADTGNMLTDYFSGLPVIVCYSDSIKSIPQKSPRLLPYNTIDSSGLIPVFKVDEVIINDKSVNAMIGSCEKDSPAIFNPKLII
jgi:stage II sporulation protein GA (sporulation sigma-E factor processing peptidase)